MGAAFLPCRLLLSALSHSRNFVVGADKSRHDKLVLLVDKMLGLMPKPRAATAESEKAVLQNAVTATDQQIDQLVYELYQLTPQEIALVEGAA